ncbi:MAG: hypothetical protein AAGU19_08025 [Prolixibacteraceae bacterium]
MENSFTPGEWFVDGFDTTSVITKDTQVTYKHITRCNYGYADPLRHLEENKANARLISSAPNMFNVCKEIIRLKDLILPAEVDHLKEERREEIIALVRLVRQAEQALKKATE